MILLSLQVNDVIIIINAKIVVMANHRQGYGSKL